MALIKWMRMDEIHFIKVSVLLFLSFERLHFSLQ